MRHGQRTLLVGGVIILVVAFGVGSTAGYPNGPLIHVSDLAPACAGCHSSMSPDQVRNLPPDFGARQVVEAKHYQAILSGAAAYKDLSPADLEQIIDDFAAGKNPAPGPRVDRQTSAPEGGPLTLLDPKLYDGSAARPIKRLPNREPQKEPA